MEGMGQDDSVQQQAQETAPAEKMLGQSEVNGLIGRAKAEAAEKARRQAEAEFQKKLEELQAQRNQAGAHGESTREVDVDAVYQQVQERLNREMQERQLQDHMKQVADAYESRMAEGAKSYEDFDTVMKEFDPTSFPQIVYLVANLDNAADVMYELAKNPTKLATIDHLSNRAPKQAQAELQRIASSIAANKAAAAQESGALTSPPLDRMQPGNNTAANGRMSVSDLRNQPWLRG